MQTLSFPVSLASLCHMICAVLLSIKSAMKSFAILM